MSSEHQASSPPAVAPVAPVRIARHTPGGDSVPTTDLVAIEEPLEIRIAGRGFAVLMRTPGHDAELATGHLFTEGVIAGREQIAALGPGRPPFCVEGDDGTGNVIAIELHNVDTRRLRRQARGAVVGSSCGTCGKSSIDQVHLHFPPLKQPAAAPSIAVVQDLPERLLAHQRAFRATGGLHAAAVFQADGKLLALREDVGRHNAVDKIVGRALLAGELPLDQHILFVSGRISFEIVQKALAARIPVIAAISAPTSLAVEFARANGQTLAGFVRDGGMNVYAGSLRPA